MNVKQDLVGKTITGVIASAKPDAAARELWMLQFSDGTHVEFVSPGARKALRQVKNSPVLAAKAYASESPQLTFSVA